QRPGASEFLRQLVTLVAMQNRSEEVAQVADFISGLQDAPLSFAMVRAFGDGLKKAGASAELVNTNMTKILDRAAATALDQNAPEQTRVLAVEALGLTSYARTGEMLLSLLNL